MTVKFAWIAPHGDEIIRELYPDMKDKEKRLAEAMEKAAYDLFMSKPDVIVIATPHNLRILEHIGIVVTQYTEGKLSTENEEITLKLECDREFAKALYENALKKELPVVAVNYGASEGEASNLCMDWGTFIPMWFVKKEYERHQQKVPPVVIVTPSREIPWENLVLLGELIVEVSNNLNKNVAFIASADQGHAHDPNGPYGYDKASEEYDTFVREIIAKDELDRLLELDNDFLERGKPDSFWQMLILLGVLKKAKERLKNDILIYECPSYFGMLVATYKMS